MNSCRETSRPKADFMAQAVQLALRGKGRTAPNPCVGAVLVKDGCVVAEGWHKACGGPHAEINCLSDAREKGVDPSKCSMFVTLEPCNHFGRTPPCSQALIEAKVPEVVIGCTDPNPDVTGGGAETLRKAGVRVETGLLERECLDLIDDFLVWKNTKRTYNILKLATTIDGKIAVRGAAREAVSCPESFSRVHEMRSRADAIIVGGNTFYIDDPSLTARAGRDEPVHNRPFAVVVTSRLPQALENHALLRQRPQETIFWTTEQAADTKEADQLREIEARVWGFPQGDNGLDLRQGFEQLRYELGCHTTLCEGGGGLAMSLARQELMDELVVFQAPRILGDESAASAFAGMTAKGLAETINLRIADFRTCGNDLQTTYKPMRG